VRHLWARPARHLGLCRGRYPLRFVPDPTERLIGKIRDFVESNGARFLVGVQLQDAQLIRYLEESRIPLCLSMAPRPMRPGPARIGRPKAISLPRNG